MLAAILEFGDIRLKAPAPLYPDQPLPATLNHYSLRFEFAA